MPNRRAYLKLELSSILIGKLCFPINVASNVLAKFCRPVLFYNECSEYELTLRGSSFLFRHKNRNFLICTSHQLGKGESLRSSSDMVIAVAEPDDKMVALTANSVTRITNTDVKHANADDILLMEFEKNQNYRGLDSLFLDLDIENIVTLNNVLMQDIDVIFAIGYQSSSTDYDPVFDASDKLLGVKIVSCWSKIYLKSAEGGAWLPDLRIGLEIDHRQYKATAGSLDYDPDGFSGAPVLFIYKDAAANVT